MSFATVSVAPSVVFAQPARKLIVVELDPGSSGIDPDAVRQAIATELGVDVADQAVPGSIGTLMVRVRDDNRATVVFRAPDGKHSIERSVELPRDAKLRHEAIALLAGNLARDEAKELADALEAAREARRREKEREREREAQETAAHQAGTEAARAAGAAARARVAAVENATAKDKAAAARAQVEADEHQAAANAARSAALAEEERRSDDEPRSEAPTAEEVHDRIDARLDEQVAALAEYDEYELQPFQAAAASPIAIYPHSSNLRFHGMLSLFYVNAGGLEGAAVTAGVHRITGNVRGAQAALVWNDVQGLQFGAQVAGIGNRSDGPLRGSEAAGILNLRLGGVQGAQAATIFNMADALEGVQASGIYNYSAHEVLGAQATGVVNYAGSDTTGIQAAGIVNIAWGHVEGGQLAGVVNLAEGNVQGAQIGGIANLAGGDLEGVQISAIHNKARDVDGAQIGLVNVGRDVNGTQIGLVNISRDLKGFPLGLVNISQTGRYQLVLWHERLAEVDPGTNGAGANLGVKFLAGYGYTLFGLGVDGRDSTWAANCALGARIPLNPMFVELDAMYRGEWDARVSNENDAQAIHYRAKLGVEVVPKRFGVFVGGGVRQEFVEKKPDSSTASNTSGSSMRIEFAPIALAGVEVF